MVSKTLTFFLYIVRGTFYRKGEGFMNTANSNAFELESVMKINGKTYIINRHFVGKQDLKEIVYETILNSLSIADDKVN